MVDWGYPKDIGNNAMNRICYDILNKSVKMWIAYQTTKCWERRIFSAAISIAILTGKFIVILGGLK